MRTIIRKQDLDNWYKLRKQIVNGYHMSDSDKRELISLNHTIMEAVHEIHNDNMFGKLGSKANYEV